MFRKLKVSIFLSVVLFSFFLIQSAQALTLGISGDKFTVDGSAKFLTFVSYFDAIRAPDSTLDSDLSYLKSKGINGIRIFPNWWGTYSASNPPPDTLMDSNGNLRPNQLANLKKVVNKANGQGLVVDISFANIVPNLSFSNYKKAIVATVIALNGNNNIFYDIHNEYNCAGLSASNIKDIRDAIKAQSSDFVSASIACGASSSEAVSITNSANLDFINYHDDRTTDWYGQTAVRVQSIMPASKPVYLGEPEKWTSGSGFTADNFITAVTQAKSAGAAAWTFHTRAAYNLPGGSLQNTLNTGVEKTFLDTFSSKLATITWGSGSSGGGGGSPGGGTGSTGGATGIQGSCPTGYIELGESNASGADVTATNGYFCDDDAIPSSISGVSYPVKGDLYCSNKNPGSAFIVAGKYSGCNTKPDGRPGWNFDSAGKPHDSTGTLIPFIGQNTCSSDQPVQVTVSDNSISVGAWTTGSSKAGYVCIKGSTSPAEPPPGGGGGDPTDPVIPPIPGDTGASGTCYDDPFKAGARAKDPTAIFAECRDWTWFQRNVSSALSCSPNFIFRGIPSAQWNTWKNGIVNKVVKACEGDNVANVDKILAALEVVWSSCTADRKGVSCVCSVDKDIEGTACEGFIKEFGPPIINSISLTTAGSFQPITVTGKFLGNQIILTSISGSRTEISVEPGINANYLSFEVPDIDDGEYSVISSGLNGSSVESIKLTILQGAPFSPSTTLPVPDKGLPTDLGQLIAKIFEWSLGLIGLVIFVRFFYAGFLWFTAAGNPANVGTAKTIMKNAVYGALVLFSAWLILNTINPDLVGGRLDLPGLPASQPTTGTNQPTGSTGTTPTTPANPTNGGPPSSGTPPNGSGGCSYYVCGTANPNGGCGFYCDAAYTKTCNSYTDTTSCK